MGAKKVLEPFHLISAGVMTGTATILSSAVTVSNLDNIGIKVKYVGTATGVISVLVSINGTDYDALTFNPVLAQPAGSTGGYVINVREQPFKYLKVQYVNASGAGVFDVWVMGKDLN